MTPQKLALTLYGALGTALMSAVFAPAFNNDPLFEAAIGFPVGLVIFGFIWGWLP